MNNPIDFFKSLFKNKKTTLTGREAIALQYLHPEKGAINTGDYCTTQDIANLKDTSLLSGSGTFYSYTTNTYYLLEAAGVKTTSFSFALNNRDVKVGDIIKIELVVSMENIANTDTYNLDLYIFKQSLQKLNKGVSSDIYGHKTINISFIIKEVTYDSIEANVIVYADGVLYTDADRKVSFSNPIGNYFAVKVTNTSLVQNTFYIDNFNATYYEKI